MNTRTSQRILHVLHVVPGDSPPRFVRDRGFGAVSSAISHCEVLSAMATFQESKRSTGVGPHGDNSHCAAAPHAGGYASTKTGSGITRPFASKSRDDQYHPTVPSS